VQVASGDADGGGDLGRPEGRVAEPLADVVLDAQHQRPLDRSAHPGAVVETVAEQGHDEVAGVREDAFGLPGGQVLAVPGEVEQEP
jgi:hypothetical protein